VYQELKQTAMEIGPHINVSKTKAMIMSHFEVNTGQVNHTFQTKQLQEKPLF
jgi:hypothetical protein